MTFPKDQITGVILAGGKGRRLGGTDKGLMSYHNKPLVAHILSQLEPQVGRILINANRHIENYQEYAEVISDQLSDFQGPLAGMQSAMRFTDTPWILTVPCDGLKISVKYAKMLYQNALEGNAKIAVAHDGDRLQPVHALIHCSLIESLESFLNTHQRKIDCWYGQHDYVRTDFSKYPDMFRNINTPEDKKEMGIQ